VGLVEVVNEVIPVTPQKTKIDTKNDALEDVSPFKHGYFG